MKAIIDFFLRTVGTGLTAYENKFKSKFSKLKALRQTATKKIKDALKDIISFVFGKPSSVKDYFKVGQWYISKRFLFKVVFFCTVFAVFTVYAVVPYLEGKLWAVSLVVNTTKYHEFTGKCKVYNDDGSLLYIGKLEEGSINGEGELYENDRLVYKGSFTDNKYEGEGALYKNGALLYDGEFSQNLYSGNGVLYFSNGNKKFSGVFENGDFKSGTEYYESGNIKFDGQYSLEGYEGEGKLYSDNENNTILYFGNFSGGKYNGKGSLYKNGVLYYTGDFVDNVFYGEGKKYEKGELVYEGNFVDNKYDGEGILYKNKKLLYKGSFSKEMYNGEGTLYSEKTGKILYAGNFANNRYDKTGVLYDEKTGRTIYEGNFLNGLYDGDGTLYSSGGKKIFTGSFFEGDVNYISFVNTDIDYIRECFGKEDYLEMLDNSFDLVYTDMNVIAEFNYSEDDEPPEFSKIKFFGNQSVNDIHIGMNINEIGEDDEETDKEELLTAYTFEITSNEAFMNNYIDGDITEGNELYCVKYLFEDHYIRAYSYDAKGKILYFEMGGI